MGKCFLLRRRSLTWCVLFVPALLCRCGTSTTTGPGGTDFPNTRTVAGKILHDNGTQASFTEVRLIPGDFVPPSDQSAACIAADSTDSSGRYAIAVVDTGIYNLQAVHLQKRTRLLVRDIQVAGDDTVRVGENELGLPGAIAVALPHSLDGVEGYLYLRGTCYRVTVGGATTNVVIDSVPAGVTPALCFTPTGSSDGQLLQDSATVIPGDTTLVAPQNGPFSLKLILNTTTAGADVAEDVYHFPLAIRFSALPIDMNQLKPDGSDLVVTRSDNTPLPYEIELWDPGRNEALVWVKVDTVFGNNATQSVYLFWGNPSGIPSTSSATVFDTAYGFSAVWHLSGGCNDATVNRHDGVRQGKVADTSGILGGAMRFHGNDHLSIAGLLDTPSTVTLSAWALLDTPDATGSEIISIGDAVVMRMDDGWANKGCQVSYFSSPGAPDTATHQYLGSGRFLAGTGWHFFSYVYDAAASEHRFFIDGELCREAAVIAPIHYDSIGVDTKIGTHGNGKPFRDFTGSIDEVIVAHQARTAAWIKLCYMNQRMENRLVTVRNE